MHKNNYVLQCVNINRGKLYIIVSININEAIILDYML